MDDVEEQWNEWVIAGTVESSADCRAGGRYTLASRYMLGVDDGRRMCQLGCNLIKS